MHPIRKEKIHFTSHTQTKKIKTQTLKYKPIPLLQISDYNMTPDVACLAESLRTCLQESDEVPTDYTQLFHTQVDRQEGLSTHEQ